MSDLYAYSAIVGKTTATIGKTTYVNKGSGIPLDSRCITGHVLADSAAHAQVVAIAELKGIYLEERGYRVHETCRVEFVEETIIGA